MPPEHLHRRPPSYFLPLLLALTTALSIAVAMQSERPRRPRSLVAGTSPVTPVLSPRRVPEVLVAPVARARLAARLDSFLADSPGPTCLMVETDGVTAFVRDADTPMTPASLAKLATATAALDRLGLDTRLRTTVRTSAAIDSNGVVDGDLYLVGGGDPLLMTDDYYAVLERPPPERTSLEALADLVVRSGLRSITGGVIGDESRYDTVRFNPAWAPGIAAAVSIGSMSALTLNGGLDVFPTEPGTRFPRRAAADPALMAAERFAGLLRERGVSIAGPSSTGIAGEERPAIAEAMSAPVRDLVKEMLRESDNMTAELLGKELGLQRTSHGTTAGAIDAVNDVMQRRGFALDHAARLDVSGLASGDRETCSTVQRILDEAAPGSPINEGLPIAARSGTLADKFASSIVAGRLRAKTGTLDVVTGLAGYLTTARGSEVTFSYIVNVPRSRPITAADVDRQEALADILDTYPESPSLADIEPKAQP